MRRLALGLALLPSCAWASSAVSVETPWFRYLLPNIPASAYMVLHNAGSEDMLVNSATSPGCALLALHQSRDDSGMAMMMNVPSIVIPAHGSLTLAPGGYHLMCMAPVMKPGERIPITLRFESGGQLSFTAPVYGAQSAP